MDIQIPHEYLQRKFINTYNRLNAKFPHLNIRYGEVGGKPQISFESAELNITIWYDDTKNEFKIERSLYFKIMRQIKLLHGATHTLADPEVDKSIVKTCEDYINEYDSRD